VLLLAVPVAFDAPRLATLDDLSGVIGCVRAAYSRYRDRMDREPAPVSANYEELILAEQVYAVTDDQRQIAGVLVLVPDENYLLIENIAVQPQYQGRGIGRELLHFAERQAEKLGYRIVQLYTNEVMTENLAFYGRHGFREIDRRTDEGFRRVYLEKRL
jgi:ribosomal protein S18 acetylase RimI-like enzyme